MTKKTNKWILQLLALAISVVLWSYVMGLENPDMTTTFKRVSVSYTNVDSLDRKSMRLMNDSIPVVNITVSGKKSDLDNLTLSNLEAVLNLAGAVEGENRYSVAVALKGAASSVSITKVEPQDVLLNIESVVTRSKPVRVAVSGKTVANTEVGEPSVTIPMVNVTGPKSWVNGVEYLRADIDVEGLSTSTTINANIKPISFDDEDVTGVELAISTVSVDVPVYNVKTVPVNIIAGTELGDEYTLKSIVSSPTHITIKSLNDLEDVKGVTTEPLDLNTFISNSKQSATILLPEGVTVGAGGNKVDISAEIKKLVEKQFVSMLSEKSLKNMPDGLELDGDSIERAVTVTVLVDEDTALTLNSEDIAVIIDLSGAVAGENHVMLKLLEIKDIITYMIEPENVTIRLINKSH